MATVENGKLHILFVPYFTPSHIIPLVDAARLFASYGVKVTIITTPCNAALFRSSTDRDIELGSEISVETLKFPAAEVGLPEGIEHFNAVKSFEMYAKLSRAISILQKPMEELILEIRPHCIFSDIFNPWTVDVAEKLKIPRFSFYASSFFYHCVKHNVEKYAPHENLKSDSDTFVVPGLPDEIEMKRSQLEDFGKAKGHSFGRTLEAMKEAERRSQGMVHDTVYELEPAYADFYEKMRGKKCWSIGPVFAFGSREKSIDVQRHSCLDWLDTQEPNEVLYISFGSLVRFPDSQLIDIALALEASNQPFIWVVRNTNKTDENGQESWLPNGFEERMVKSKKGLIIRTWAPQLMILNHPAVGGFMTHCGWNSMLEAISAGVPMITFPVFSEQFYHEKLVEVLQFGVRVGSDVWNLVPDIAKSLVGSEQIEKAIKRLMCSSEESEKIRQRVKEGAAMVKIAVEKGGSSRENLIALIEEIKSSAFGNKI